MSRGADKAIRSLRDPARDTAAAFSGGQLQRLLLERELSEIRAPLETPPPLTGQNPPRLLVLSEPRQGLDIHAGARLAASLRDLTRGNASALIFSTDIDELIAVSDEILVLRNGEISAAIPVTNRADAHTYKARVIRAMT
jgi:ABC-type uncharacterized transport system ATPase subunit